MGLYPTLNFIRQRNGAIGIRSGNVLVSLNLSRKDAQLKFDNGYENNPTLEWLESLSETRYSAFIPGTHVFVDLRLPERGEFE